MNHDFSPLLAGARIAAALLCFGLLYLLGLAQTPPPVPAGDMAAVGYKVRHFLQKADHSNRCELRAAQLAVQRAGHPAVKQYAAALVTAHQRMADELQPLLDARLISFDASNDISRELRRLGHRSGKSFDTAFLQLMHEEHREDVELFEDAGKYADDPAVQRFASHHLNELNEHWMTAEHLQKGLD